jgi:hypothetical protein
MELAAAGENLKKLREIARAHIEKAAAGDMQAIKDLAGRRRSSSTAAPTASRSAGSSARSCM